MTNTNQKMKHLEVSHAYTLENVEKYEKVLEELFHVMSQKINTWDKNLNASFPIINRRNSV